jgi:hypothetical protein
MNFEDWRHDLVGCLRMENCLSIVTGKEKSPDDATLLSSWLARSNRAAGIIWRSLGPTQRTHVNFDDDPDVMWSKIDQAHNKQLPAVRFSAYNDLFNVRKDPEESLTSLMSRVDKVCAKVQSLRPKDYTLAMMDDELAALTLLRALPESDLVWTSSLMMNDSVKYSDVKTHFTSQESLQSARAGEAANRIVPTTPSKLSGDVNCTFCGHQSHNQENCYSYNIAQKRAKERTKEKKYKKKGKAAKAEVSEVSDTHTEETVVETAGNASVFIPDSSDPHCALLVHASSDWTADTGASSHMTPHRHWFSTYTSHIVPIEVATGHIVMSAGIGNVKFRPKKKGKENVIIEFTGVLHVPSLNSNLISVLYLTTRKNWFVTISGSIMSFYHNKLLRFTATRGRNNTPYLDGTTVPMTHYAKPVSTCPLDSTLWHRRFSHLNHADVKRLLKGNMVTGMKIDSHTSPDPICEPCLAGKQHRSVNKIATMRYTKPLALIHSDVHGPLPTQTVEGYRYWVSFIDDASRYVFIVLLKLKSDVFEAFKQYKAHVENLLGQKIKMLRDDKGGEYMSKEFNHFLTNAGISRQHTVRNEPHQNGVAERFNRTLQEAATSIMTESHLPPSMWGHAVDTCTRVHNISPTSSLKKSVPYTVFHGRKPDVSHLRVFGCTAYVHVQKDQRTGLGSHTQKCVFIGYPPDYKGWKFYNPLTKKVFISKDAVFDERLLPGLSKAAAPVPVTQYIDLHIPPSMEVQGVPNQVGVEEAPNQVGVDRDNALAPESTADSDSDSHSEASQTPIPGPRRNPPRNRGPPKPYWLVDPHRIHQRETSPSIQSSDDAEDPPPAPPAPEHEEAHAVSDGDFYISVDEAFESAYKASAHDDAPRTLAEALKSPDADMWYDAAYAEMQSLIENGTFRLAKLPPGRKAIGSRWVFVVKRKKDGSIDKFKARLVAKGYAQRPGFDFTDTFAPTAKWATLRAVLALAALEDMELESVDISSAFLNGELEEEVYLQQPEGFHKGAKNDFLLLLKGLYGLRQSPRIWHKKLNTVLISLGFKQVLCDHSIWVFQKDGVKIILPVFVDDMTIASKSKEAIQRLKADLKRHFKLHDLGPITYLLGVGIERDRKKRSITLSQRQYILDMLKRYGHADCNPIGTPMEPNLKLSKDQAPVTPEEIAYMKDIPYIHAVGSLMYLAVATRPDIAYTVGVLARFNHNPGKAHWLAVKHVFRYLKGTLDLGLTYSPTSGKELFVSYSDADHGGDKSTGKSTGAYVVKMGTGAISWQSKLQKIVTLSTTEAEYIAAVSAGQEILWLRNLFEELGYPQHMSSTLYMDNQSAIAVARDPEHHGRMKHLDLRTYWLRQEVDRGKIKIFHVPTTEMPADILTKALSKPKVEYLRNMMGLR